MTSIEWTDETWNPTTGCDRVSPGCDNCYALTMAKRLNAMGQPRYQTDGDPRTSGPGFGLTMHPDVLDKPLSWRKPRRVFVNSMSDLWHPRVTMVFIARVFAVMARTPQHTYQILTKRPKRMRQDLLTYAYQFKNQMRVFGGAPASFEWPLPNVWLGTSVEDQERADQRIPPLLDTPAAVRFLSCEPLLGPVDLDPVLWLEWWMENDAPGTGKQFRVGTVDDRLHWVIVGGESGGGARPMDIEWARTIVAQCREAGVAAFVKQLGSVWAQEHSGYRDLKGGDPGWWPEDLRVREYPQPAVPA